MSDNEKNVSTEDDTEESFSRLPLIKTRVRRNLKELRHPRQKFCARWEKDFPWLKADKVDESVGICTVCDKRLVCKKSHLERHQNSYKHRRLQGFDSFDNSGDQSQPNPPEFMECGKRELEEEEQEFGQAIEMDPEYNIDFGRSSENRLKKNLIKRQNNRQLQTAENRDSPGQSQAIRNFKLDRFKLLKRVDRDRNALNEYYLVRKRQNLPPIQQTKDTFDLFFDSVCATAKALPPKLGAEVKGRISQLIAEFELRAICEREAQECSTTTDNNAMVVPATTTHHQEVTASVTQESAVIDPNTGVPHIVYTFQPKASE
ncbi:protein suppressor of variegation 3-7 [Ceratitis capitata]|uniref:(Mediterranean fruit fly) hypothetical protein n=1 Tax=Ceratitis capitata TaxID=7213 RepID=W8C2U5_CERCA|nr:protein suppressor of variegation 3-7 [Ceratitis capitata]XP_020716337.1 protein suppressor of variegation 3-7 [Ceratitis capitata]CAD6993919.1 unnamed protein product [Ceratitis capitata]